MSNPFRYGCIVTGKYFCDRPEITSELSEHIRSGQNVVVYGERRIGKSSAVAQTILDTKGYSPLAIDLLGIKSIDGLIKRIIKAVIAREKSRMGQIFSKLASIRPNFSLDPISGIPTVSFDASIRLEAQSIGEALSLIQELYGKKKVVVVLDEFQDILKIGKGQVNEALSILRSNIQHQPDIPYIFVGSIRKDMEGIFLHQRSPFFKSAIPIEIQAIDRSAFKTFIKRRMAGGKRNLDDRTLENIFDIANDITGDIQQFCEAVWAVSATRRKITPGVIQDALELIFSREGRIYEDHLNSLTDNQYRCLLSIARHGGRQITSGQFMLASGFGNASSLRLSANRMIDINILFVKKDSKEKEYCFVNPFFRAWLLKKG